MDAKRKAFIAVAVFVLADLWFVTAARSYFWGFGSDPWYSEMATILLLGVVSGLFFILGRKYLTVWNNTGQLLLLSKLVEFLLLPIVVVSWFVKYHFWLLLENRAVGISALAVVLLMQWLRKPLEHFVEHEVKIRDFEYMLGTAPIKHRLEMLLADIAVWGTFLVPLIFFWQKNIFIWVPK